MRLFSKSKWIWNSHEAIADSYVDFCDTVRYCGGTVQINLSCDTDYTLYVSGVYVASGQYGDFEHYKIYDTPDLTDFLHIGENTVECLVYYCGVSAQRYIPAPAGPIYEILCNGEIIGYSNETVPSRFDPCYAQGAKKSLPPDIANSFWKIS